MDKNKILFCINVPWQWIKQRPHFIAEGLAHEFDLTVLSPMAFHKYQSNETKMPVKTLYRLPLERFSWIAKVSAVLQKIQLVRAAKKNDIIWLSLADQYNLIKSHVHGKKLVYDCMDDMLEFEQYKDGSRKDSFLKAERDLFVNADVVFASSEHLKNVLIGRYGNRDVHVVNNALRDGFSDSSKPLTEEISIKYNKDKKHITYIGTIDSWMDFELIMKILNQFEDVVFHLWGPIGNAIIPKHERLVVEGSVEHDYVLSIMEKSDLLMMPFIVTKLIESVNPVKLYEYIFSGKPSMAPLYGESKPFGEYCLLYQSHQECLDMIDSLEKSGYKAVKSKEQCESFARANTWSQRVKQMEKYLL